jgi:hypothetical protein
MEKMHWLDLLVIVAGRQSLGFLDHLLGFQGKFIKTHDSSFAPWPAGFCSPADPG